MEVKYYYYLIACIIALLAVIAGLIIHYRRTVNRKNRGLARQILENYRQEEKMERLRIEKETLEKCLKQVETWRDTSPHATSSPCAPSMPVSAKSITANKL